MERAPDPVDFASNYTDEFTAQQVAAIVGRPKVTPTEDCESCGYTIPKARQEATGGTNLCIDCASIRK